MCGIAGFSCAPGAEIDASAAVRVLLAGLAERGEDACGYGWRDEDGAIHVVKRNVPPLRFLSEVPVTVPRTAREVLVHVRDHTKGRPSIEGNNHPIRHGSIVGVHNGIIQNDDELFTLHGRARSLPGMSVDSEAIFMLLDACASYDDVFPQLRGSYATAFLDDRRNDGVHLVRGLRRPLELSVHSGVALFASTHLALEFAASTLGIPVRPCPVDESRMLLLRNGVIAESRPIVVQAFDERPTVAYEHADVSAQSTREMVRRAVEDDLRSA